MAYKHGTSAEIVQQTVKTSNKIETNVVYVGTAPINLIKGATNLTNVPIELSDMSACYSKMGYSDNWEGFTLCEAMKAHFMNSVSNIGPIYVINVLDLINHKGDEDVQEQLSFKKGIAEIKNDNIIIDSILIDTLVKDVDYVAYYDYTKKCVIIELADKTVSEAKEITYSVIDCEKVTKENIIGSIDSNNKVTGMQAIKQMYRKCNAIPNILACPGWSHEPQVRSAMLSIMDNLNGHWNGYCVTDIPIENVQSIQQAIDWKEENGYNSKRETVCYPMVTCDDGMHYHLSTIYAMLSAIQDNQNDGVPFETCSNKTSNIIDQWYGEDSEYAGFESDEAKSLNENGITTASYEMGKWVVFGGHTAAYKYNTSVDAEAIFDTNMRMLMYVTNSFQLDNGSIIDDSMDPLLRDSILSSEQAKLDALVAIGALIGSPSIEFNDSENTTENLMNGDFVFAILATPTPHAKSLHCKVSYTTDGFAAFYGGEE